MKFQNLLIISNNFPNKDGTFVGGNFVKEQVKYLKKYFENIYVVSPVAFGMDLLRKTHHENYIFDNVHVFFPKYLNCPLFFKYGQDIWIYLEEKAITKLIKDEGLRFDLIHAHFTWRAGAVAVKLKETCNVPVVITEHTSQTFTNAIEKKKSQFIRSWKLCDAIIRVRKGDIPLFKNVGVPLEKVDYIPNGYSPRSFLDLNSRDCRKQLGLPLEAKVILNVGNLYNEVKGHKYLIEAMDKVIEQRKDVMCFILGGGKLENQLKKQISSLGLEEYIKLVGSKPYHEIPIWMNACDVFVLPSLNEGNPTVMFECLGCGKPFIGTRVGGIPEIITSENYGLLCDPAKSVDLADNILLALTKEWDKGKIKEYAEQFTWENIAQKILKVYSEI
jgi:glycosyltransferase involved in cell wall biosynthesis